MPKSGASTFLNHRVEMTRDGYVSSHLATVYARSEVCDGRFLLYYLSTVRAQDLIQDHQYPSLTLGTIGEILIPLPPLDEQKRIVAVLDQAFAALDCAHANIKANLTASDDLFQGVLDREFSQIVDRASTVPLREAVQSDCGLSYGIIQPGNHVENGLPIVRPVDLTQPKVGLVGLKRIDPDAARGYARTTLYGRELLLCVRGNTGVISVATEELEGANVTRGIVPIRFDETTVLRDFAYFQFLSSSIRNQIAEKTYGAALMQINIKDLRDLRFIIPEISIQQGITKRIQEFFEASVALHAAYQEQLVDLTALRQSLLQAAFSDQLS